VSLKRIEFNEFKKNIDDNLKKLVFIVIENDELYFYISDDANDEGFYFLKNHYLNRTYLYENESVTLQTLLDNEGLNDIYNFLDTKNFFKMNKGFLYHIKDSLEDLKNIDQFMQIQTNTGNFQVDIFGFENTTSPITNININKKDDDIKFHKFIKSYYNKYKKLDWYKNKDIILPIARYKSNNEDLLKFNAIKGSVLDANNIYRGFISARDLVENIVICENDKGFQRNIYQEHVEDIKNFLDSNDYKYKYFSEITIAIYKEPNTDDIEIKNIEESFYKIRININNVFKQYDCNETITSYKEIWQKRKYYIIDGRHRLSAIKEFLKDKDFTDFMLSINIIIINRVDEFDPLAYFYYINQKQRALIPEDYINLINTFEENRDFIYDWNVVDIVLFNLLKENFKRLSWIKLFSDNDLSVNLLKLINYMKENSDFKKAFFENPKEINNIIEKLVYYLDIIISNKEMKLLQQKQNNDSNLTLQEFLELIDTTNNQVNKGNLNNLFYKLKENNLEDKFYVLIYLILHYTNKLLSTTYNDIKKDYSYRFNSLEEYINAFQSIQIDFKDYIRNEILGKIDFFLEYKDVSQHLKNPESIIKIIENLYMEKSRIIFYSSKFEKEYERNYYIVKDVISDIEKELGIKIYFLRLDKPNEILPTRSFDIHNSIVNMIKKSGLLIADISGNSANVYHEIGLKMGLDASENKNPNLIIMKDAEKKFNIPFNIGNLQYINFPSDIYLQTYLKEKLYSYFVPKKLYFS